VREVKPDYTQAALNARIHGVVLLEALVLTEGQVGDVRMLGSLASKLGLDDQAVKALRAWRF
jgi:TonB family protein